MLSSSFPPLHIYLYILFRQAPLHLVKDWSCHLTTKEKGHLEGSWFEVPIQMPKHTKT
jgi:hypothetical protein